MLPTPATTRWARSWVFSRTSLRATARRVRPIFQQRDAVQDLLSGIVLTFWADDGDVVAGGGKSLALQPDATVERHGQILDDGQGPRPGMCAERVEAWFFCTFLTNTGHTAHPIPS